LTTVRRIDTFDLPVPVESGEVGPTRAPKSRVTCPKLKPEIDEGGDADARTDDIPRADGRSTSLVGGLLLLGQAATVQAQTHAATAQIRSVTGQVEIQRKGETQWTPAVVGAQLAEGDNIRAHAGASAVLDLPEGSTLFVAENSRVAVSKLEVDSQNNARDVLFHLVVGKVRALVSKASITLVRARQSNFSISTPTAVAAARGTDFEVTFNADKQKMGVAVLPEPQGGSETKDGSL
jgi:hypothetical protein